MSTRASSSWQRARQGVARSIKLRMILVFLLLAGALAFVFFVGAQRAFSLGWREAARPLLTDYVSHLTTQVQSVDGRPSVDRALALTQRLPLAVRIQGPRINWASHPNLQRPDWWSKNAESPWRAQRESGAPDDGGAQADRRQSEPDWQGTLQRTTADGHTIEFGINGQAFERRERHFGFALAAVLVLTLLAWLYVRHLLKPLDTIGEGVRRFGAGDFDHPIALRHPHRPDELGELAFSINAMGADIRQMLDAKRALLLAISHELRSPLTRARLNTELLPETAEVNPQRQALLRDLREMADLINGLLESERLSARHAVLQREPLALGELAREVMAEVLARQTAVGDAMCNLVLNADSQLPELELDPVRIRLLLRNLLDNALRHGTGAHLPPELHLRADGKGVQIEVRDHGPGVPDDQIAHLADPFFRPDSARTRAQGGVGLGMTLCKLVAHAHGGSFVVRNAQPGLAVIVTIPADPSTKD